MTGTNALHVLSSLAALGIAGLLAAPLRRRPDAALGMALLLALPGLWAALRLPAHWAPARPGLSAIQGACLLPICILPPLLLLRRLAALVPPGDNVLASLERAARSLGADRRARWRLVWLPLLAPAMGMGAGLALCLSALCAWMRAMTLG